MAKKVGVVLALDGEQKFTQGMKNAAKEVSLMKTALKNVESSFKEEANSIEALTAKQKALTDVQEAYSRKLEAAKTGLNNAKTAYKDQVKALEDLKNKLEDAKKVQKQMEDSGDKTSEEYKKQSKAVDELTQAVGKQEINMLKASGRITDWSEKVAKSENELKQCNDALKQNESYLNEAKNSADHCATSIDKFGNEVKNAGDDLEDAGQKALTFGDILKANISADLIVDGLKKVGEAAVEAGKYVIEVGSDFEQSMSEVEAISGSSGSQLEQMAAKAKKLGSSTKFSASEVAQGFKYMSLAGWSAQESIDGIDGVLNLAAASGMELAEASDMLTDYLSAFGLEAQDAAKMADMMAYAQAHSNTSAQQLGEAYGNAAAGLNAAGQDIETVTSMLEGMANQGMKGSEAGTALNSIMSQITQKMKDGAIQIGETSVAVQDQNGNFRDLTDILKDVETATDGMGTAQRSAALSSTFNKTALSGLNLILNEGADNIAGYEKALRNCDGAAEEMSRIMNDNLKGDLTNMGSALEGLGIAAYDYIDGPARAVVQGVTGMISGITDAITPQKTELETFIEDVRRANDEVSRTLESSKNIMEKADTDVAELEAYKKILVELAGAGELNAFQQYQAQNAISALSGSIPELSGAYDENTKSITMNANEIERLITNQEKLVMQNAAIEARTEAYKAQFEAQLNAAKAESAHKKALEELTEIQEKNAQTEDYLTGGYGEYYSEVMKAQGVVDKCAETMQEANAQAEQASKDVWELNDALDQMGYSAEQTSDNTKESGESASGASESYAELSESAQSVADSIGMTAEEFQAAANAAGVSSDEYATAVQNVIDAYDGMTEAVSSAIQGSISLFDEFSGGAEVTADQILTNLQSQIDGINNWKDNMAILGEQAGDGMSQELYDKLAQMGPESANIVQELVNTLESDSSKFKEISDKYAEALKLDDSVSDIVDNTQVGKDMISSIADGILESKTETDSAIKTVMSGMKESAQTESEGMREVGEELAKSEASGFESGSSAISESAEQATMQAVERTTTKKGDFQESGQESGEAYGDGLDQGITSGIQNAISGIDSASSKLRENTEAFRSAGEESGKGYAEGVSNGLEEAFAAAVEKSNKTAEVLKQAIDQFKQAGNESGNAYAQAILATQSQSSAAAQAVANAAKSGASSQIGGFTSIGYQMSVGMASGISSGGSAAISAAVSVAAQALSAAKAALDIHSPSRKFRKEVGQMVGKGFAFGIRDSASLASNEASKMSNKVFKNASSWLKQYKKSHDVTISDTIYFWSEVVKHTKTGTNAYNKAIENINDAIVKSVSKKDNNGKKNKDPETYYSEIYRNAQSYVKNQIILNDMSTSNQIAYWKNLRKHLKSYSQAWIDATEQIKSLQESQRQETLSMQETIIDTYKTYKDAADAEIEYWESVVGRAKEGTQEYINAQKKLDEAKNKYLGLSLKAEMQYWNIARKQFKEGTEERIEADRKYYEARTEYYEELKELEEDYAEKSTEIEQNRVDKIKDAYESYSDKIKSTQKSIMNQMNLFESWDAEGYDKNTILSNLEQQVKSMRLWADQLNKLRAKGLSKELLDELEAMGPEAAANLWSLNQMTQEELDKFQRMWNEKAAIAYDQAQKSDDDALAEMNKAIKEAESEAKNDLDSLEKVYRNALAKLNEGLTSELASLVTNAAKIGTAAVNALVQAIQNGNVSSVLQNTVTGTSTDKVMQIIKTGMKRSKTLTKEEKADHHALWEYLVSKYGYAPNNSIYTQLAKALGVKVDSSVTSSQKNEILKALKKRGYAKGARKILEDQIALTQEAGREIMMSGSGAVTYLPKGSSVMPNKLSENMFDWGEINPSELIGTMRANMEKQDAALREQFSLLSNSGLVSLNRAMENYAPDRISVNVDNSSVADMMQSMLNAMQDMVDTIGRMRMVTDTGVLAGQMQASMSRENAAVQIRRQRGRF